MIVLHFHNSNTVLLCRNLKSKYGVSGIPKLVVVKKNGVVITGDGRSDVMRGPGIYNQWASR